MMDQSFHASSLLRRSDLVRTTGVELIVETNCIVMIEPSACMLA